MVLVLNLLKSVPVSLLVEMDSKTALMEHALMKILTAELPSPALLKFRSNALMERASKT